MRAALGLSDYHPPDTTDPLRFPCNDASRRPDHGETHECITSQQPDPLTPKPLREKALLTRLTEDGPTSNEVATTLLHSELAILYPDLSIDLGQTVVGTPIWEFIDNELTCVDIQYIRLTHVLVRISLENSKVNYLPGEQFLTQQPCADTPIQLPVNIEKIATLLNDLASVFFVAFKEQQLAFWNSKGTLLPRWQELADGLAAALNIQKVEGWNADHCDIARAISMYPEKQQRLAQRPDLAQIQVCVLDIDTPNGQNLKHLLIAGTAVVHGMFKNNPILMMYTIEYGYETFPSLQDLTASARSRLDASMSKLPLSMRLVEPAGNFFDHMAWALVATQLNAIETEGFTTAPPQPEPISSAEQPADIDAKRLDILDSAIPKWLLDASPQDLNDYSQYMLDLSTLYSNTPTDLFAIQPIKTFAQEKMRNAIIADKKASGADKLPLDDTHITITDSLAAGPFTLANPLQSYTQTLGEYALSNTPPYLATVSFKGGATVPDWLTHSYLTQISAQVDIGQVYPKLIRDKLIDDPVEAPRQKKFYSQQLQSLLPLLALEFKLKKKGNVDEQGYRCIQELVKPTPNAPTPMVIRPLSIRPSLRIPHSFDEVLNVYVIGPRDWQKGPFLLYRPLLENPLIQFPSLQNLHYELYQPGEIRDSMLAWLPNRSLSFNYAQYVFPVGLPSPWMVLDQVVEPFKLWAWGSDPVFSGTEMTGDIFAELFATNAKAMAELADRESLSNAERRWTLLKDSGWAIFNVASNFFTGAVASAVWVWQLFDQLQQALDAHELGNSLVAWQRLSDVLMALAIAITHKAAPLRRGRPKPPSLGRPKRPLAAPPEIHATISDTGALSHSQFSILAVEGAVPRRKPAEWDTYLDAFKVKAPELEDEDVEKQVPPLYHKAKDTYAQVDQRWFQVAGDQDGEVHILDPKDPSLTGPCLTKTPTGTWGINTQLRLLRSGESLKNKLKASREAKARARAALELQRTALEQSEQVLKGQMETLFRAPLTNTLLEQSLSKAQELISNRQDALRLLEEWRGQGGTTDYRETLTKMYERYNTYLLSWTAFKHASYNAVVERILENRGSEEGASRQKLLTDIDLAKQMGRDIEAKLNNLAQVKDKLSGMGASGLVSIRQMHIASGFHSRWELKTNEIANAAELCIREQAAQNMAKARSTVYTMVERATSASRSMVQLLKDEPHEPQLETLAGLLEEYQSINSEIDGLTTEFPGLVDPTALGNLKSLINEFLLLVQGNIARQLQQDAEDVATPALKPVKPSSSKPSQKIRVIKTRPRDQPQKKPADTPKPVPLKLIPPYRKPAPQSTGDYAAIINQGMELTQMLNRFIHDEKQSAKKSWRIPADMEDIFNQQAVKMEETLSAFEPLHEAAKQAGNAYPVASLPDELRAGAARLRQEAINIRAQMIKLRKPRQLDFQWMRENNQLRITRNTAGRIKTKQLQDYFQEYLILDAANHDKPLWVAHFHYPSLKTPADQFTAAHLKIDEKYLHTLPADQQLSLNNRTALDNSLRTLKDPVNLAVFLQLEDRRR